MNELLSATLDDISFLCSLLEEFLEFKLDIGVVSDDQVGVHPKIVCSLAAAINYLK